MMDGFHKKLADSLKATFEDHLLQGIFLKIKPNETYLGQGINLATCDNQPIFLPDLARSKNLICSGMAGTGKTLLLRTMAAQDIKAGRSLLLIDFKGSSGVRNYIEQATRICGREKDLLFVSGSNEDAKINILNSLQDHDVARIIMESIPSLESHLRIVACSILEVLIQELRGSGTLTIPSLLEHMKDELNAKTCHIPDKKWLAYYCTASGAEIDYSLGQIKIGLDQALREMSGQGSIFSDNAKPDMTEALLSSEHPIVVIQGQTITGNVAPTPTRERSLMAIAYLLIERRMINGETLCVYLDDVRDRFDELDDVIARAEQRVWLSIFCQPGDIETFKNIYQNIGACVFMRRTNEDNIWRQVKPTIPLKEVKTHLYDSQGKRSSDHIALEPIIDVRFLPQLKNHEFVTIAADSDIMLGRTTGHSNSWARESSNSINGRKCESN